MDRRTLTAILTASVALVASTALLTVAGPLSPPAGAVAPTYKTLTQVEPRTPISASTTPGDGSNTFRITQPGSYYLTGNIQGVSGDNGILVTVSHVTIDLGGFTLLGGGNIGISASLGISDVTVRNGSVTGWNTNGIGLSNARDCRIESVIASGNTFQGISVGPSSRVESCTASNNGGAGIIVGDGSLVLGCVADANGTDGISLSNGCTVELSTATGNADDGFSLLNFCLARACVASENGGDGFTASDSVQIIDCGAYLNGAIGINGAFSAAVDGCTVVGSGADGIDFGSYSRITNNLCRANGVAGTAAGLYCPASTTDAHVEGNTCVRNDRGIEIDGTGNVIIRNSCGGNTTDNYDIAAGNHVGTVAAAPASAAFAGNTGGSGIGTTSPWGNIAY